MRSWESVEPERRLRLKSEYPEMEAVANAYHKLAAQYRLASSLPDTIPSEGIDDCSLDFCWFGGLLKSLGKEALIAFSSRSAVKTIIANEGKIQKVVITLKQKPNMNPKDFNSKAKFLEKEAKKGNAIVTKNIQRNPNLTRKYRKDHKNKGVSTENKDVDHKLDLQLGGKDSPDNMWLIDKSVNRGVGKQIQVQTKNVPDGTKIDEIKVVHLKK